MKAEIFPDFLYPKTKQLHFTQITHTSYKIGMYYDNFCNFLMEMFIYLYHICFNCSALYRANRHLVLSVIKVL
jgi:hypothetical protein